jgi:hypothetical protein
MPLKIYLIYLLLLAHIIFTVCKLLAISVGSSGKQFDRCKLAPLELQYGANLDETTTPHLAIRSIYQPWPSPSLSSSDTVPGISISPESHTPPPPRMPRPNFP